MTNTEVLSHSECGAEYESVHILGCPISVISFQETLDTIEHAVRTSCTLKVAVCNVDMIMKMRKNKQFHDAWRRFDIWIADGVPLTWVAPIAGKSLKGRVSGTDTVWHCGRISAELDCTVALIGGMDDVARQAAEVMTDHFPGARVVAIPTPFPLGDRESDIIAERIRDIGASIVLVALGAPRQEYWIDRYLGKTGANVGIGIGSAFDIISGRTPRAPGWMKDNGLEWFYRFSLEPKRLFRRYFIEDSPFFFHVAKDVIKNKMRGDRSNGEK